MITKKQYQLIDWSEIEGIVYADCDHPYSVLGLHTVKKEKMIQAFFPNAQKADVVFDSGKTTEMELLDEAGFFAVFVTKNEFKSYHFSVLTKDGEKETYQDPYAYSLPAFIGSADDRKQYELYNVLGANSASVDSTKGVLFSVYAPYAQRVSLVGTFNHWDGRMYPMQKLENGIFRIFMPEFQSGCEYGYEIFTKEGICHVKNDPFAKKMHNKKSIWVEEKTDRVSPLKEAKASNYNKAALNILEVDPAGIISDKKTFREGLNELLSFAKEMNYSKIQFLPFQCRMGNENDYGFQSGLFALDDRYGSINDMIQFVKECHACHIGVYMELNLSYFANVNEGPDFFDGTHLFEHADPKRGYNRYLNAYLYRYSSDFVRNYLKSFVHYWITTLGLDGVHFSNIAPMLYLDYQKTEGDYILNEYGGKENTEGIEFIRDLNAFLTQTHPYTVKSAEVDCVWKNVTTMNADSLGFDFMWNTGFADEIDEFISLDPSLRPSHYHNLISHLSYAHNEHFILPFSHRERKVFYTKDSLELLPGTICDRFDNARIAMCYSCFYPGKKLSFYDWVKSKTPEYDRFVKELNEFYVKEPLLYQFDFNSDNFAWIQSYDYQNSTIAFIRKGKAKADGFLVFVINFSNKANDAFTLGVPQSGKYMEIFNSDAKRFGGKNVLNPDLLYSDEKEYDGFDYRITIKLPAMSAVVFSHTDYTQKELEEIEIKKRLELEKYVSAEKKNIEEEMNKRIQFLEEQRVLRIEEASKTERNRIENAKKEEEQKISDAKQEAKRKISDANKEAEQRIYNAKKEAEQSIHNVKTETEQSISYTKKDAQKRIRELDALLKKDTSKKKRSK